MEKQLQIFKALQFASWAHRNNKRKLEPEEPYIFHPFHVFYLLTIGWVDDDLTLIVGILHDVLEENPEEVTYELLEKEFGKEVADGVLGVTLDSTNPNKRLARLKILQGLLVCKRVKAADVLSHIIALTYNVKTFGLQETERRYKMPLKEKISMETEFLTALYQQNRDQVVVDLASAGLEALAELMSLIFLNEKTETSTQEATA